MPPLCTLMATKIQKVAAGLHFWAQPKATLAIITLALAIKTLAPPLKTLAPAITTLAPAIFGRILDQFGPFGCQFGHLGAHFGDVWGSKMLTQLTFVRDRFLSVSQESSTFPL